MRFELEFGGHTVTLRNVYDHLATGLPELQDALTRYDAIQEGGARRSQAWESVEFHAPMVDRQSGWLVFVAGECIDGSWVSRSKVVYMGRSHETAIKTTWRLTNGHWREVWVVAYEATDQGYVCTARDYRV